MNSGTESETGNEYSVIKNGKHHRHISDCDKPLEIDGSTLELCNNNLLVINTNNNENFIYNGYKLLPNAKYILKPNDILIIGSDKYHISNAKAEFESTLEDTNMKNTITSFFKPISTRNLVESPFASITGFWECVNNSLLIFTPDNQSSSSKIAAFDLDGTLIKTKSGKKYAEDYRDWKLAYNSTYKELLDCYDKEYKLVMFTNQLPLDNDLEKQTEFKQKIEDIFKIIKLPMQVFAATKKDIYRKPCPGMWQALEHKNDVKINLEHSFFVGDAAGRPKSASNTKDHSFADLLFSKNIGLRFLTPEEFFLKARHVNLSLPQFNPEIPEVPMQNFSVSDKSEVVIMVGPPGSGKSTFCDHFLLEKGYVHVNRDTLGSWQNCIKLVEESLQKKLRVVVDNTNRDKPSRKRFIDVAVKYNVPCRCFVLCVDKNRARHNNKFRELINSKHAVVSEMIIHSFYKYLEDPSLDEGFSEVVVVNVGPIFKNNEHQKLYNMYLLDKYSVLSSSL